jgi:hypothetical protein
VRTGDEPLPLPYGLVQLSKCKFVIVQGGQIGFVPIWYAVETEPAFRSLMKAVQRVNELNGVAQT